MYPANTEQSGKLRGKEEQSSFSQKAAGERERESFKATYKHFLCARALNSRVPLDVDTFVRNP